MSDFNFNWKGKRVLITGHTGFKGTWLCLWMQLLSVQVHGYARVPPTRPNLHELTGAAADMESIIGDIRDLDLLQATFDRVQPEIVFHLAAQPIVQIAYEDPVETFSTNTMGTVNLLECARRTASVKSIVVVTSDKCYTNHEWHWAYREKSQLGGRDPYAASKSCAELIVHSYRESYFNSEASDKTAALLASVRAGNVIGGGDWAPHRLVPDIISALREDRPLVLRHPKAIRPWQHVLEPLRGYLQGAFLKLDCSKARALLGWAPVLRLADGLQWIADWYQAMDRGEDMREVTIAQIESYRELAAVHSNRALNAAV